MVAARLLLLLCLYGQCTGLPVEARTSHMTVGSHGRLMRTEVHSKKANSPVCQEMWDGKAVYGADGANACDVVPLAPHWTWGGGAPPNMCLRPAATDFVCDIVR